MKQEQATALAPAPGPSIEKLLDNDPLFEKLQQVRKGIASRAFDFFQAAGFRDGHDLHDWLTAESEVLQPVPIDMTETDQDIVVKAQIPGFSEKDIDLRVDSQRLYITGKHEESSEKMKSRSVYSEWRSNQILREVELPVAIDPDDVRAHIKNGVLEVTMPKLEKPKKIQLARAS